MSTPGFTVWVTGPEPARLHAVADEVARRLAARAVPAEVLDARTPGLAALSDPARVAILVAALLARHGVAAVIAFPATRALRDAGRGTLTRMIEVDVPAEGRSTGHEPPERPAVELTASEIPAGAERVLHALEILRLLPAAGERGYSEEEERAVIRRLKAFGYL